MPDELLHKLRMLQDDYPGQPLVAQKADLREINQIRSQLGMPLVDARLHEIGVKEKEVKAPTAKPKAKDPRDHAQGREIYQAYLKKIKELEVHQVYAERVARATSGPGMTPVRPLATMGTNGGPLLCDQCGKPIVLEGGSFHGKTADEAWRANPGGNNWTSWILGGLVVEIQVNGTLRIYHGYPGRNNSHCCNVASREHAAASAKIQPNQGAEKKDVILAFLEYEFPDMTRNERLRLLTQILDTLYSYDPGIGVNRPNSESGEGASP